MQVLPFGGLLRSAAWFDFGHLRGVIDMTEGPSHSRAIVTASQGRRCRAIGRP